MRGDGFVAQKGNYKTLLSYQKSVIIYDCTYIFCDRFLNSHDLSEIHLTFCDFVRSRPADVCANIMICLINQCNYLLDRQIKRQEEDFTKQGGLREQMYNARMKARRNHG